MEGLGGVRADLVEPSTSLPGLGAYAAPIALQNGSFAFDRELKAGKVKKRTRKTKVS